jgi:hypothetical protein
MPGEESNLEGMIMAGTKLPDGGFVDCQHAAKSARDWQWVGCGL